MTYTIYLLTCKTTGLGYIGCTVHQNLNQRLNHHVQRSRWRGNSLVSQHIRRHGKKNFMITPLVKTSSIKKAREIESHFIHLGTLVPQGLNMCPDGRTQTGRTAAAGTKLKMSTSQKRRWADPARRTKQSRAIAHSWKKRRGAVS